MVLVEYLKIWRSYKGISPASRVKINKICSYGRQELRRSKAAIFGGSKMAKSSNQMRDLLNSGAISRAPQCSGNNAVALLCVLWQVLTTTETFVCSLNAFKQPPQQGGLSRKH